MATAVDFRSVGRVLAPLGLAALAIAVYVPSLTGDFVWDDDLLVNRHAVAASLRDCFTSPFLYSYCRPLTALTFYIDNALFTHHGRRVVNPFFYHQTNILIHAAGALLMLGMLRAAFPKRPVAAWLGAILFAVQPAQVSAVGWIGGRTDALSTMFAIACFWALISGVRSEGRARTTRLIGSLLLYAIALFSKEQLLATVPLVPLAFLCFDDRNRGAREDEPTPNNSPLAGNDSDPGEDEPAANRSSLPVPWRDRARGRRVEPWLLTLSFIVVSTLFMLDWRRVSDPRVAAYLPLGLQLEQIGQTFLTYWLLLFLPAPRWMSAYTLTVFWSWRALAGLLGFALLGLSALLFVRWMRTAREAAWMLALTVLALLPVLNVLPLGSLLIGPYRAALSGVGAAGLLGWLFSLGADRLGRTRGMSLPFRRPALLFGLAYVLICASLNVWGAAQWGAERDGHTTEWSVDGTVLRYDPDDLAILLTRATDLINGGHEYTGIATIENELAKMLGRDVWDSRDRVRQLLKTRPEILDHIRSTQGNQVMPRLLLANMYAEVAYGYVRKQRIHHAVEISAIGFAVDFGQCAKILVVLGQCAGKSGDMKESEKCLKLANRFDPKLSVVYELLATIYAKNGRWADARQAYERFIDLEPTVELAYLRLGAIDQKLGDTASARRAYSQAVQMFDSEEARHLLRSIPQ